MYVTISDLSEQFQKGSYLLTPPEMRDDPAKDRFHGFRQRLKMKFDWLCGYLTMTQQQCLEGLEDLDLVDPLTKAQHNVRPSEAQKVYRETERGFLAQKNVVEQTLKDTILKLGMWNSYFGVKEEEEDDTKADGRGAASGPPPKPPPGPPPPKK